MSDEPIFNAAPGEKFEDDRSRLAIFFGILGRKFWKLITINLMFIVFNLPSLIVGVLLSVFLIGFFLPSAATGTGGDLLATLFISGFPTVMFLMAIPVLTTGPCQAGFTYLLKCYSTEMPVFNWMDFKDKIKENMKQGTIVGLINLFLLLFLLFDLYLYSNITNAGILLPIANGLLIVVFLLFMMLSIYLYPMMVTYNLKIKDLYKNALLFAVGRFLPNLLVLILCFLLTIGPILLAIATASSIALTITYIFYIVLGFSLPGLIINFFINPVINKYMKVKE